MLDCLLTDHPETVAELIDSIEALGYAWGQSDGN
jgi:hypothetical protein